MTLTPLRLVFALTSIAAVACADPAAPGGGGGRGEHGDEAAAPLAAFYREIPTDDLKLEILSRLISPDDDISPEELAELVDIITEGDLHAYLQGWIDHLFDRFVDANPAWADVPHPELVIITDGEPNAFVMSSLFCIPLDVDVKSSTGKDVAEALIPSFSGEPQLVKIDSCEHTLAANEVTPALRKALVDHLGAQVSTGCKFTADGDRLVASGTKCKVTGPFGDEQPKIASARNLAIPMTVNKIVLRAPLLESLPELTDVLTALSHELTHYLRAHAHQVSPWTRTPLVYDARDRMFPALPDSDPAMAKVGDDLLALADSISGRFDAAAARYHGALFERIDFQFFETDPAVVCEGQPNSDSCIEEYVELAQDQFEIRRDLGYPRAPLDAAQAGKYAKLEARMRTLFERIPVRIDVGPPGFNISELVGNLPIEVDIESLLDKTADEVLVELSAALRAKEKIAFDQRDELATLGFARYTDEVAADEGVPLLFAAAGLEPTSQTSTFLLIKQYVSGSAPDPLFDIEVAACDALRAADWKVDGNDQPPIWGFPAAEHPGFCWRTYNFDRFVAESDLDIAKPSHPAKLAPKLYPALRDAFLATQQ